MSNDFRSAGATLCFFSILHVSIRFTAFLCREYRKHEADGRTDGRTDWVQRLMRLPRKGHMTYTVEYFMRDDLDRSSFRSSYRYYQHCGVLYSR